MASDPVATSQPFDAAARISGYFAACNTGSASDIAAHFTPHAVIYDTNLEPVRGAEEIGRFWVKVRERWQGARWQLDGCVAQGDAAAIEWSMRGVARAGRPFVFRGSEHYAFERGLIAEIRQYWSFDPTTLDTGLVGFEYPAQP